MTSTCRQHGSAPLTFQQRARLERARQSRLAGSAPRSNLITDAVSITGPLDVDRLQLAVGEVWRRQPALRSRFFPDHQEISPCQGSSSSLPRLELSRLELSGHELSRHELSRHELSRLDRAPLDRRAGFAAELAPDGPERFALALRQSGERQHELSLAADHLVFDARSVDIFWKNLWRAYLRPAADAGCLCEPGYLELLTLPASQPDRGRELTNSVIEILRQRRSPFGYLDIPVRLSLDAVGARGVSVIALPVPDELADRVADLARRRRATVFAVITAAAFAAIRAVSHTETPMLYTYLENRGSASARTAIGWFAATALLTGPGSGPGDEVGDEVERAKRILLDALLFGARATEEAHRACGDGKRPATLPSVSLSLGQPARDGLTVGDLEVTGLAEVDEPTGSVPRGRIAIEYWPRLIQLSYETDRFDASTVRSVADAVLFQLERLTT